MITSETQTGIQTVLPFIINSIFMLGGIAAFALFIIVLIKANKALNIWLDNNRKNGGKL